MKSIATGLVFAATALGQACQTQTLATAPPTDGTELALSTYSYCGGTLNATGMCGYSPLLRRSDIVQLSLPTWIMTNSSLCTTPMP